MGKIESNCQSDGGGGNRCESESEDDKKLTIGTSVAGRHRESECVDENKSNSEGWRESRVENKSEAGIES